MCIWLTDRLDQQLHVYQLKTLIKIVKVTVSARYRLKTRVKDTTAKRPRKMMSKFIWCRVTELKLSARHSSYRHIFPLFVLCYSFHSPFHKKDRKR